MSSAPFLSKLPIPKSLYRRIRDSRRKRIASRPVVPLPKNLSGDRDLEWSWVSSRIPSGPGRAIDFGPGGSYLSLVALHKGFEVTAIDREALAFSVADQSFRFLQGDILEVPLEESGFDLVINCSTVEHVGIVGRYGIEQPRPDGDLQAMEVLRRAMKHGGTMILTIPTGRDGVFPPMCRVYGQRRLPELFQDLEVVEEEYWSKDDSNLWIKVSRDVALDVDPMAGSWSPLETFYSIGCFLLRKPASGSSS